MEIRLPPYINETIDRLESHGYEAFAVGGCVRDMLLGLVPHDYDICTSASPDETIECFADMRVIPTGVKHGTVTLLSERPIEITAYREDGSYTDCRHPDSVKFLKDISGDLARRDFTVNAMAYSEKRGLVDLYGGREDLQAGLIRCVGDPCKRFGEDALRIIRAMRFSATYGFEIEKETSRAAHELASTLNSVSVERIFSEFTKLICGKNAPSVLREYPDIVSVFIPEISGAIGFVQHTPHHYLDVWEHTLAVLDAARKDTVMCWAALLHDMAKPDCFTLDANGRGHFYGHPAAGALKAEKILERLHSDGKTKAAVCALIKEHDNYFKGGAPEMRVYISKMGRELADLVLEFRVYDSLAQSPEMRDEKLRELERARSLYDLVKGECLFVSELALNGDDLAALGVPPGKQIGEALRYLLDLVISGKCENSREPLSQEIRNKYR